MIFKHIRDKNSKAVITVCHRSSDRGSLVGVAFSAPNEGSWDRKKGNRIAEARSRDSPIYFEFEKSDYYLEPLEHERRILLALRALVIAEPEWKPHSETPLRPSRFTHQYAADLIGPDGTLLKAVIDVKPRVKSEVGEGKVVHIGMEQHYGTVEYTHVKHWCLRVPSWARTMLEAL